MDRTSKTQYALFRRQFLKIISSEPAFVSELDQFLLPMITKWWAEASDQIALHYCGSTAHQNYLLFNGQSTCIDRMSDHVVSMWRAIQCFMYDPLKQAAFALVFGRLDLDLSSCTSRSVNIASEGNSAEDIIQKFEEVHIGDDSDSESACDGMTGSARTSEETPVNDGKQPPEQQPNGIVEVASS